MAGLGKRFRDAGYSVPKYQISVHGKTLFSWSMLSLQSFIQAGAKVTFVVQETDSPKSFIINECASLGIIDFSFVELKTLTDGQATSALLGGKEIAHHEWPFLIYNIDTFVHPHALPFSAVRGQGWIPCFPGKGSGWSFALASPDGKISLLKEKVRISSHASIGLYWFSSFDLYHKTYQAYYGDEKNLECGEKYIAPMFNQLIKEKLDVYLHEVPCDSVIPLGTPSELEIFRSQQPSIKME